MKWQSSEYPPDGTWCWLTDGINVWIAVRHRPSAGGWTNEDTWEDWEGRVKAWKPLETPDPPVVPSPDRPMMDAHEYSEVVRELVRAVGQCDLYAPVAGLTDKGRELLRQMERKEAAAEPPIDCVGAFAKALLSLQEQVGYIGYLLSDRGRELLRQIEREAEPQSEPFPDRYPMCADQPAQVDCRREHCKFHVGSGKCSNPSPAITLNGPPSMTNEKGVCWSHKDREMEPPSWDDVPEWAEWLLQSQYGQWYAFEMKPRLNFSALCDCDGRTQWLWKTAPPANWRDTLQERPKPEPELPCKCGSTAVIIRAGDGGYNVGCRKCIRKTAWCSSKYIAANMWRLFFGPEPAPEPVCPVCGKPASEHRDGLFCCGHCRGEAMIWTPVTAHMGWNARCNRCKITTIEHGSAEGARAAWNRRA